MKVVVLTSGGMDSSVLLAKLKSEGHECLAIGFNYGQRHQLELAYAAGLATKLSVPFTEVDLSQLREVLPGSSQTDDTVAVPEGKYDEESMKATVVPNRNMILLSIAIGHAIAHKCDAVAYAAHAGDHAVYPDCRPEFAAAMEKAARLCDWTEVRLLRPFVLQTKADIARFGKELGMDWRMTWSCYRGRHHHCGRCGTCIERREAFYLAGIEDPTSYDAGAPTIGEMVKNDWHLPTP